jgi:hypothetical protein
VAGSSDTNLWLMGPTEVLHYDGRTFVPQGFADSSSRLHDLFANAADNVWVVGRSGDRYAGQTEFPVVRHFNGSEWTFLPLPSPPTGRNDVPLAVWATAKDDVWFGTDTGRLLHFDGEQFVVAATPFIQPITSFWGGSRDDIYATGGGMLAHYDGKLWSVVADAPSMGGGRLYGFGRNDVWLAGGEYQEYGETAPARNAWHFDGVRWTPILGLPGVHALGGHSSRDLWFYAGEAAWHYDGKVVTQATLPGTPTVRGYFQSPQGTLWAAGRGLMRKLAQP